MMLKGVDKAELIAIDPNQFFAFATIRLYKFLKGCSTAEGGNRNGCPSNVGKINGAKSAQAGNPVFLP